MAAKNIIASKISNRKDVGLKGLPNFFLAGCQKTASTWLHRCFREHPDIYVPENDATHYFTMNYYKGLNWYCRVYEDYSGEKVIGDTTPSYIRDYYAPSRIAEYNRNAKLIFTFRNPIDRAFSHYWHEKKKRKIAFKFNEALENYDLYENWIVAGFYHQHLSRYYEYFQKEQILVLIYEDLKENPYLFLKKIFNFLEVDDNFVPSVIEKKVNVAWHHPRDINKKNKQPIKSLAKLVIPQKVYHRIGQKISKSLCRIGLSLSEYYDVGITPEMRDRLRKIFDKENQKLSQAIGRDLSHWN
jgi:hypothetical protein